MELVVAAVGHGWLCIVVDLAVRGRETHKRWVHAWRKVEELGVVRVHGGSRWREGELLQWSMRLQGCARQRMKEKPVWVNPFQVVRDEGEGAR